MIEERKCPECEQGVIRFDYGDDDETDVCCDTCPLDTTAGEARELQKMDDFYDEQA